MPLVSIRGLRVYIKTFWLSNSYANIWQMDMCNLWNFSSRAFGDACHPWSSVPLFVSKSTCISYASEMHRIELRCVEYTQLGLLPLKKLSAVVGLMMIFRLPMLPNTLKVETDILTTRATLAKYIYEEAQSSDSVGRFALPPLRH